MSLANVLPASQCARSVFLLGDPQQLEQPQQGSHPTGADLPALEHILPACGYCQLLMKVIRTAHLKKSMQLNI